MKKWVAVVVVLIVLTGVVYLLSKQQSTTTTNNLQPTTMGTLSLISPVFKNNEFIPAKYTCDGDDISPPLLISGAPEKTKSLVLIMDDTDAPVSTWDHWLVFNIQPTTGNIEQGQGPSGIPGKNSWGRTGYGGPCPPSSTHRYFFKLYALDTLLDLPAGSTKKEIEQAMEGHILDKAELVGLYQRKS